MSVPHQFSLINTNDDWAWPGNETFHQAILVGAHAEGDRFFFFFVLPITATTIKKHDPRSLYEAAWDEIRWDVMRSCHSVFFKYPVWSHI